MPIGFAGDNSELAWRQTPGLGQQLEDRVVGLAAIGRRRDTHFKCGSLRGFYRAFDDIARCLRRRQHAHQNPIAGGAVGREVRTTGSQASREVSARER